MPKKGNFERKIKFDHFLACLVFTSILFHFLFFLNFTLNFSKHGCDGGDETYFSLRIIHVFVYARETSCGHLSIIFAILCLFYESVGHRERSIWSHE